MPKRYTPVEPSTIIQPDPGFISDRNFGSVSWLLRIGAGREGSCLQVFDGSGFRSIILPANVVICYVTEEGDPTP